MNDGDGSKVVLSLNFNPTPGAQDPWDMQHIHFATDQPNPDKWGKTGYDRDVDWYDPGASENPGAEDQESEFAKLMYSLEQSMNTIEDDTIIDDATD